MCGDNMDKAQMKKYELLGANIYYYRRKRKLTQEQLAERTGIEPNHISNIELAKIGVSLDVLFRIADVLEIPVYKLFEFRE